MWCWGGGDGEESSEKGPEAATFNNCSATKAAAVDVVIGFPPEFEAAAATAAAKEFEEADKLIRETTGADDINDICQKFSNLRETKEKLKKERRDLEKQCEQLGLKKEKLVTELNKLKYQGQDEITRKELEDVKLIYKIRMKKLLKEH